MKKHFSKRFKSAYKQFKYTVACSHVLCTHSNMTYAHKTDLR